LLRQPVAGGPHGGVRGRGRPVRKMAILRQDDVDPAGSYPVPVEATGVVLSKLLSPPDYVLWLVVSELEAGAWIVWAEHHSDQALYVFSGALSLAGHPCPERGAVIVES